MAKIEVQPLPRVYSFTVNGYSFKCFVDWRDDIGVSPVNILIADLEQCLDQLRQMPEFKVQDSFKSPPLSPDSTQA